jgi:ferredoxin-nitrite reductase
MTASLLTAPPPAPARLELSTLAEWPDTGVVCACKGTTKAEVAASVRDGHASLGALAHATGAGGEAGCGACHAVLGGLIACYSPRGPGNLDSPKVRQNKVEVAKAEKDGLDCTDDIARAAASDDWRGLTEDDKARFKWHGLFFRKQTPGHFMLRLRSVCGRMTAEQFRVIAELSDAHGKGFCDLTTRQQVQMRWFTLAEVPGIWERLAAVGLHSRQTGMDNVRGVVGCPLGGVAPNELFDASPVAREVTEELLGNKAYTNLPRKFNVTITGCLDNCCHAETQDLALVPAIATLDGEEVNGFNAFVGGKQGSGGLTPARPLDVFVPPEDAAELCGHVVQIFRDHGLREQRNKARLAFLLDDLGVPWFRAELELRLGRSLPPAGRDPRAAGHHSDHLGFHKQKGGAGPQLWSVGLLVPVGRITTSQMRGVADLADRYGSGTIRMTVQQNLIISDVPEEKLAALRQEPLLQELQPEPSPVMRGLVACVGSDYCHLALIETKGWAIAVARELDKRVAGRKVLPLTIHWSGCSAGCGLHQAATIGLQACRSRVDGQVVDAAHVFVRGQTGPQTRPAEDLLYDVPCDQLADALEPLVKHLPRK